MTPTEMGMFFCVWLLVYTGVLMASIYVQRKVRTDGKLFVMFSFHASVAAIITMGILWTR